MVQHAIAAEDKQARFDNIMAAALALFVEDPRRLPSVSAIASKAGLAKGTFYLYFETKEQVFASLLSREWHDLLDEIEQDFKFTMADRAALVHKFILNFVSYLESHFYFLQLDSLGYALLEANLPPENLWEFKMQFAKHLEVVGAVIDQALLLPPARGLAILIRSYSLTRGLWQLTNHPDSHRQDPRFAAHPFAAMDFGTDLREALVEYWGGALELRLAHQDAE